MDSELLCNIDNTAIVDCFRVSTPEDTVTKLGNPNNLLTLLCQNIRSVRKNFDYFSIFLSRLGFLPDIIILTECWLDSNFSTVTLSNYDCHISKEYLNKNDGIIVLSKCGLTIQLREPKFRDGNCLLIDIGTDYSIIAIYRSPSTQNISCFLESLEEVMSLAKGSTCIITGDINIDIKVNTADSRANEYLNLTAYSGFISGHHFPTRGPSCLDHMLLKTKSPACVLVCDSDITDHDTVIAGINKISNPIKIPKYYSKIDYQAISKIIIEMDWSSITTGLDVNDATHRFINLMTQIIQNCSSKIKVRSSEAIRKPWMTTGLLRCVRKRDLLHQNVRKSPDNTTSQQEYKKYRNYCNDIIKKVSEKYYREMLIKNKDNIKKLWQSVTEICYTKKTSKTNADITKILEDPVESVNSANMFFSSVGKNLADAILSELKVTERQLADDTKLNSTPGNSFFFTPTDPQEIVKIIDSLKKCSAPGNDMINNTILKQCKWTLAPVLAHLFNLSMSTGVFPNCLKVANVCPIFKSGDPLQVTNYRPISLLSSVSKILEKLANNRLQQYLESKKLLSHNQYGFRQKMSTEDAVITLVDHFTERIDSGHKCVGVFLDMAKAFDTVSRPILLEKLALMGIRGLAQNWFHSYLSNRLQRIKAKEGEVISEYSEIHYGVPQGSVLGPTLFLVYINDLCDLAIDNAKVLTFADDTAILFHSKTWPGVVDAAQRGLARVMHWLQRNLLTLNASKTKYIAFKTAKRYESENPLHVKLHSCRNPNSDICQCVEIEQVDNIKYLGVLIDYQLSWTKQIDAVSARIRKLMFIFKKLKNIADRCTIRCVYLALCQSILNYCIGIWGTAAKSHLIKLERAQRGILKVAYGKPYRYPTDSLYEECNVLRVRQLFVLSVALRFHRQALLTQIQSSRSCRLIKWVTPATRTKFAQRSPRYVGPYIYQKLNKILNLVGCSKHNCKTKITKWLSGQDYEKTEALLM